MRFREATAADAEAIATLHANSWRKAYRGLLPDEYLDGPVFEDRRQVWTERLSEPRDTQRVIVATDDGGLVGFACVYTREDPERGSFLDNIHAHPDRHSRGIGTGLFLEVVDHCRRAAPEAGLYLYVFGANAKARRFYEHLGATDTGSEVRAPGAGGEPREIHTYAWPSLDDVRL